MERVAGDGLAWEDDRIEDHDEGLRIERDCGVNSRRDVHVIVIKSVVS